MKRREMFIAVLLGGLYFGGFVGLAEALYLEWSANPPDHWALSYGFVLYGAIAAMISFGWGAIALWVRERAFFSVERSFALSGVLSSTPLMAVVSRYLVNKDVYEERGVPLGVQIALLVCLIVVQFFLFLLVPIFLRSVGRSIHSLRGGLAGFVLMASGLAAIPWFYPAADPRTQWAHSGEIPTMLKDKPNLIVVMVDTLRADALGVYSKEAPSTPNVDRFAADAVLFEQAYAQASWTRASGASLFTSRIPSGHGAALKSSRLADENVTFAEQLQENGLVTAALIDNINLTQTFNFQQGFDTFIYLAPDYRLGGTEGVFGLSMYKLVLKVLERLDPREFVENYYQPAPVVVENAKGFIEANKNQRWMLFMHFMDPHDPYFEHPSLKGGKGDFNGVGYGRAEHERPPAEELTRLKELYYGEVTYFDREFGKFIDWLKTTGQYDETMIVFTADHGEEFMEHGSFWHGTTLYEEQLKIPLIVKLPKSAFAGMRIPWTVRSIDIAPTLVEATGIKAHESWEGTSLFVDIDAKNNVAIPSNKNEEMHISENSALPENPNPVEVPVIDPCSPHWPNSRTVIAEQDFEGNQLAAIVLDGMKWIKANEGNRKGLPLESLFHLVEDPTEQQNRAGDSLPICGSAPSVWQAKLEEALGQAVVAAARQGAKGGNATMDAAECERLKALGYLGADEPCGG